MRVSPALMAGATNTPSTESVQAAATTLEERLLALRGQQAALLRPFLALGMLCGLTVIWLNAAFGWDYRPAALTPGERFSEPVYNVKLEYMLTQPNPNVLVPTLLASIDGEQAPLPLGPDMVARINGVDIQAQPDAPALVVRTVDGAPLLARPGQETPVNSIGLSFPSAGSEETLLLPRQAIGLRIVRLDQGTPAAADDTFQVEVYRSGSEEAVARSAVGSSQIETISAAGENVSLALVPLPSLSIQVRRAPGLWLVWVALALATVGLLGYRQQPGFVLAQIGPWPENRSVVTVQSNLTEEMGPIRQWHEEK